MSADRAKELFIGSISHELRSPLHGILAVTEMLHDLPLSSLQVSLINTVQACAMTLTSVINHLLDFSKLAALSKNLRNPGLVRAQSHESIDLAQVVEQVVNSCEAGHDVLHIGRQLALERGRRRLYILLDFQKREQGWNYSISLGAFSRIIMNLVDNAIKFTHMGYVLISLRAEPTQYGVDEVYVTVQDTGKGISPQFQTQMFTPFAQEDPLVEGTGLGLSIVEQTAKTFHGQVDVASEVGRGTRVELKLPLAHIDVKSDPLFGSLKGGKVYLKTLEDCEASVKL